MGRGESPPSVMDKLICVNVRGLNHRGKQLEVQKLLATHRPGLIALLETRIKPNKMGGMFFAFV